MTTPGVGPLVALIKAVGRLALPCEDQIAYLQGLGTSGSADELALEFGEGTALLSQFVQAGWLAVADADKLRSIDQALKQMSGSDNAHLWTEASLCGAPEWESIRTSARYFFGHDYP